MVGRLIGRPPARYGDAVTGGRHIPSVRRRSRVSRGRRNPLPGCEAKEVGAYLAFLFCTSRRFVRKWRSPACAGTGRESSLRHSGMHPSAIQACTPFVIPACFQPESRALCHEDIFMLRCDHPGHGRSREGGFGFGVATMAGRHRRIAEEACSAPAGVRSRPRRHLRLGRALGPSGWPPRPRSTKIERCGKQIPGNRAPNGGELALTGLERRKLRFSCFRGPLWICGSMRRRLEMGDSRA